MRFRPLALALSLLCAAAAAAQEGPSYKVGAVVFTDYTYQQSPQITDANGNAVHLSAFNVSRAYLNVFGTLTKQLSFRITPDVSRETGNGSSLAGSQNFRLKYAYLQFTLPQAWFRAGAHQTPWIDYEESIYRYRFQGTVFAEREGFLISSDTGISGHYDLPGGRGDIHAGYYNGEGYAKAEANNEKALQLRASLRPLSGVLNGLRLAAFIDDDHVVAGAPRRRLIGNVTFEHARLNAGFEALSATDQAAAQKPRIGSHGWSAWMTPRLGHGFEVLLRVDRLGSDSFTSAKQRDIEGLAYWLSALPKGTSAAVLLDHDHARIASKPPERRYAIHMLLAF